MATRTPQPPTKKRGRPRKGDFQVVVRFSSATLQRLDAYGTRIQEATGLSVSRAEVIRSVLDAGLTVLEGQGKKK